MVRNVEFRLNIFMTIGGLKAFKNVVRLSIRRRCVKAGVLVAMAVSAGHNISI